MRRPPFTFNLMALALLVRSASVVFLGGPRIEAAFEAGVIVGAGLILSRPF